MIQVEHLSKVYGKGENEVVALNDVSFSVKKGEFVAIIRPSGSCLLYTSDAADEL